MLRVPGASAEARERSDEAANRADAIDDFMIGVVVLWVG
jgi:hypothetical protein